MPNSPRVLIERGGRLAVVLVAVALASVLTLRAALVLAAAETQPASGPATSQADLGPDVVMLKALADKYDPVPFEHRKHARMAEMTDGCLTCHHRQPNLTTQPAADGGVLAAAPLLPARLGVTQEQASGTPACKSCHRVGTADPSVSMPTLKGAYHRQCLNCHHEWMGGNACGVCHKARDGQGPNPQSPTPDDIVGRMPAPIPQPDQRFYKARYTPSDGVNVMFRHKEHTATYGIKCVTCHGQSACSACHREVQSETPGPRPLQPARNWKDTHAPCLSCHREARCAHCHYQDGQMPPPVFDHAKTGQMLDKNHARLACQQCHPGLQVTAKPTCGDTSCHRAGQAADFPAQRPGVWTPATRPAETSPASTQPGAATVPVKPTYERIRR